MPTEVIKKQFLPDMRFLIFKYAEQLRQEIKQAEEIENKLKNVD